MASFPNLLGALVTDHLINNTHSERCTPVIRAVVRDLKKYMALKYQMFGQRRLPLGFGGGSYKYDRKILDFLAAGDDEVRVDFWTVRILLIAAETSFGPVTDFSCCSARALNGEGNRMRMYMAMITWYGPSLQRLLPRPPAAEISNFNSIDREIPGYRHSHLSV